MDLDSLRDHLTRNLNDAQQGRVICEVWQAPSTRQGDDEARILEHLRTYASLQLPHDALKPLPRDLALAIARRVIRGILFSPGETGERELLQVARGFVQTFAPDARFYSTSVYAKWDVQNETYSATGPRLLDNSFEEGVLIADDSKVGALWVGDES